MFRSSGGAEDAPFELCLKCVKSVLLNKIVSSEKDLVGVVLYGTDKSQNKSDFKHVYVLQDLDTPDAPRIKQIEDMLRVDSMESFAEEYGHSDHYSLSDVFWTCSNLLSDSASKNSHKRIILFTNNDQPHSSNPSLQRQAKTKAKDLAENGVEIELMHIGRTFDVSLFYQDVIFVGDEDVATLPDPSEKFEELLMRVRSKEVKKRTLQRIPLSLGPDLEIGVGVYCLVREAKKPSFVRLDQRSNEELKTRTKQLCEVLLFFSYVYIF
jgi:ATP-dependent DNA helicase 2 subunit 1